MLWDQGAVSGQANFPGKLCQLRCELQVTHFASASKGHGDSSSLGRNRDEDQAEVAATAQKREEQKAGGRWVSRGGRGCRAEREKS